MKKKIYIYFLNIYNLPKFQYTKLRIGAPHFQYIYIFW